LRPRSCLGGCSVRRRTSGTQFDAWLAGHANTRTVRSIRARPIDLLAEDLAGMTLLPPVPPATGITHRVRLARDYYVRMAGNDYSVHPGVIGRLVDITATLERVTVTCSGQVVADHQRCWARHLTITDPAHVAAAAVLRRHYRQQRTTGGDAGRVRTHRDGHQVPMRSLPDYDALYGVDFTTIEEPSS